MNKLFFEANGKFTLLKTNNDKSFGLSIIPDDDLELLRDLPKSDHLVCGVCGYTNPNGNEDSTCSSCGNRKWVQAVASIQQ